MRAALLSLLRFAVALVQMAGLLAYFHQYLDWGLFSTVIVALLMTLLVPLAATIFGFLGAIHAWAWPWWLALLVFLPGLAMALAAMAGVGIAGLLSGVLLRRLRTRQPEASPFSRQQHSANAHEPIEGEVLSSRVDGDPRQTPPSDARDR